MPINETEAVRRGLGKWSLPDFPRRGWTLLSVEDLYDFDGGSFPFATCEVCEHQTIRYIHTVMHPDWPEHLDAGCVCAGHLTQDYAGCRRAETERKNLTRRRLAFPHLQAWRTSDKGNEWLKRDGWKVCVFRKDSGYSGVIEDDNHEAVFAKHIYPSSAAAKLAAFDAMRRLEMRGYGA